MERCLNNVIHKGCSSEHFCKKTKDFECWKKRNQCNTIWSLELQIFESRTTPYYLFWNKKWEEVPWPMVLQHFDDVIEGAEQWLESGQLEASNEFQPISISHGSWSEDCWKETCMRHVWIIIISVCLQRRTCHGWKWRIFSKCIFDCSTYSVLYLD